ncbi:hypothetical protein [Tropicimonas marinistellae]|uniref:hypothetical protein n=1 Tax=Tropicimonas marinistellae TaxID=1739787 RepID=UPI000829C82D|nr:hypothetical protein [Tropicimonas marinistellae]
MPDKRLVAVVTALMMSTAAFGVRAQATLEQLETIDRLLSTNDTRALWFYMQQNPELLAGNDELSLELRKFCNDVTLGRLRCHYVPSSETAGTGGGSTGSGTSRNLTSATLADSPVH